MCNPARTDALRRRAAQALTRDLDIAPMIREALERSAEDAVERLLDALREGLTAEEYARVIAVLAGRTLGEPGAAPHEPEVTS